LPASSLHLTRRHSPGQPAPPNAHTCPERQRGPFLCGGPGPVKKLFGIGCDALAGLIFSRAKRKDFGHNNCMARPRKPVAEIALGGNFRPSRHADRIAPATVNANASPLTPPPHLTSEQQDIWRTKLAALPPGFIRPEQSETLEQWCVCWDQWLKATSIVAENGVLVDGRDGKVRNPAVVVQMRMGEGLQRLETALRLNDIDFIRRHTPEPTPVWIRPKDSR
jgi:P27 family predicted phage terminase small subunit